MILFSAPLSMSSAPVAPSGHNHQATDNKRKRSPLERDMLIFYFSWHRATDQFIKTKKNKGKFHSVNISNSMRFLVMNLNFQCWLRFISTTWYIIHHCHWEMLEMDLKSSVALEFYKQDYNRSKRSLTGKKTHSMISLWWVDEFLSILNSCIGEHELTQWSLSFI